MARLSTLESETADAERTPKLLFPPLVVDKRTGGRSPSARQRKESLKLLNLRAHSYNHQQPTNEFEVGSRWWTKEKQDAGADRR